VTVMDGSIFARQNPDFSSFKDSFLAKHELKSSGFGCSSTPIAAANGQKQRVGKFTEKKKEPKKAEFEEIYKQSTENLFYAPPVKNQANGGWKSQTLKR